MLLKAAELLAAEGELPVNLRFACDGEEEVGGPLDRRLARGRRAWRRRGGRLRRRHGRARRPGASTSPCAASATSTSRFAPGARDLHSGIYGGASLNAMHALAADAVGRAAAGRAACRSRCGRGIVPPSRGGARGLEASCRPGAAEIAAAGRARPIAAAGEEFYLRTWAEPSVDVHGINGGSPTLQKTVIPVEAEANVSIRLAAGQDPAVIAPAFERCSARPRPTGAERRRRALVVRAARGSSRRTPRAIQLGLDAFEEVLGTRPLLVRTGGAIPLVSELAAPRRRRPSSRLRAQRVEHPLAERAHPRGLPAARDRDRRGALPPPRRPWLARLSRSPLAEELAPDVLERFLRYVRIDTQAEEGSPDLPEHRQAARPLAAPRRRAARDRPRRRRADRARLRLRDASGHAGRAGDRAHRARRHHPRVAGDGRRRRSSTRATRAARSSCRATRAEVIDPDDAARARAACRPRHRHERRDDAARRRRQGRRGRDHGRRRVPPAHGRRRVRPCASRSPSTRRSGTGPDHFDVEAFGAEAAYTLDGSGPRRDRDRDVLGAPAQDPHRGARRASWLREGQARQRGQAGGGLRRLASARRALAGDDRGTRGVRPSHARRRRRSRRRS